MLDLGLHGHVTAGEKAKPNLLLLTIAERGKPIISPETSGKLTVREALGSVGKERRKKRMPLCNGEG